MPEQPDYPQAPFGAVMPHFAQQSALAASAVILGIFIVLAVVQSFRRRTALPPLFLAAGFATILMEPLIDNLGHALHPAIGQINLFTAASRPIPLHGGLMYAFYFGGVYMFMLGRMADGSFNERFVWKAYALIFAMAYIFEIFPVQSGLWIYYDMQALWIWRGGMPLFWTFVNTASIFSGLTLIKLFFPLLRGWRQPLVILLSPIGVIAGHFGAGFAFYNATNSAAGPWLVQASGVISVAAALLIVWICGKLLAAPALVFSQP